MDTRLFCGFSAPGLYINVLVILTCLFGLTLALKSYDNYLVTDFPSSLGLGRCARQRALCILFEQAQISRSVGTRSFDS